MHIGKGYGDLLQHDISPHQWWPGEKLQILGLSQGTSTPQAAGRQEACKCAALGTLAFDHRQELAENLTRWHTDPRRTAFGAGGFTSTAVASMGAGDGGGGADDEVAKKYLSWILFVATPNRGGV
jgi:hypothetical protein